MVRPVLYSHDASPPCRGVLLAIEALGLDVEIRVINLLENEQLDEKFQKINPQHTLPTLDDNGFILWDSHAIVCYLTQKYGNNDSLYPKDFQKRAIIDQRLHFDGGNLFPLIRLMVRPLLRQNKNLIDEEKIEATKDAYDFLNKFLVGKKWLTGDSYTLADTSCAASISSMDVLVPISPYPNLVRWLKTCEKELPGYAKANGPGCKLFHDIMKSKLKSN